MIFYIFTTIVILIILYFLALMPKIFNRPSFDDFKGFYYAHRGLHENQDNIPENSMTAFKLAIKNNYGIELDVHITKDSIPIVFHDKTLKRVCGLNKKIEDMTYDELRKLYLFNSKEKIPHFKEVLDLINGQVPIIVELKGETLDTNICKIVASYLDGYEGIYCVESFNPILVNWYKNNRPEIIRGQLSTKNLFEKNNARDIVQNFLLSNLLLNFFAKPDFIAFEHIYSDMLSFNLCKIIYHPFTMGYTIQSQEDLMKNKDKFDLFIFDNFIPEK